jgi:hypothetical protein
MEQKSKKTTKTITVQSVESESNGQDKQRIIATIVFGCLIALGIWLATAGKGQVRQMLTSLKPKPTENHNYPVTIKNNFMDSCIKSAGGESYSAMCDCMYGKIERKYDLQAFIVLDADLNAGKKMTPENEEAFKTMAQECVAETKK